MSPLAFVVGATELATYTERKIPSLIPPHLNYSTESINVTSASRNDMDPSPNQTALICKVEGPPEVSPKSVTPQGKAVVSPIRRTPTEIWAMIFVQCLCEHRLFIEAKQDEAPLNVAGVCQRWRTIALSTPSLWSSIWITRTPALDTSYPRRELVSLWLARSAPCSISFSFTIDMTTSESSYLALRDLWAGNKQNSPDQEALVGVLLSCMERWKSVQFALPFLNGYDIEEAGAPLLESVKVIKGVMQSWSTFDPFIHRIWEHAPRLRIFTLCDDSDWSCRYEKDLLPVPFRLTVLEIDYDLPLILCWLLFRESPELTRCNFGRFCGIDDSGSNLPPVFLPELHSLTVTSTIHSYDHGETLKLTNVLSLITAPNLKKFEMLWDNGYVHEPFMSFIARSACALTELFILSVPIPKREMKEVLEAISGSIKVLKVEVGYTGTPFGKDLLRSLTWRGPNEKFLCPNLERILLGRSAIGKRDSLFIRMVESRWNVDNGRVQLKEVEVHSSEVHGPPLGFDQLEVYRTEGLKLKVDYDWDTDIKSDTEGEDSE